MNDFIFGSIIFFLRRRERVEDLVSKAKKE
jgi:hypothetical protein